MRFLIFLSEFMIPLVIFYVIGYGITNRISVYDSFVCGAGEGLRVVVNIVPTMVGLMVATGVLRASGFLDFAGELLSKVLGSRIFPAQLFPLTILKMFSSSASAGLLLDLFKQYGTDSYIGLVASLMLSSTETIFYTMSIYFMTAKIKKTRYTLCGALLSTAAGIAASIVLAYFMVMK